MSDEEKSLLPQTDKTQKDKTPSINYAHWACHNLYQITMYMIYGACLGTLVPHTTSLGMGSLELSFTLAAWPLGCILAMIVLPLVLKLSFLNIFICLGSIHVLALSSLYLTSSNMTLMIYGGSFALFLIGACHFMLVNRSSALVTMVLQGNTSKAAASVEVCTTLGWSVGAYSGTVLNNNIGFGYTMLTYTGLAGLLHLVVVVLLFVTRQPARKSKSVKSKSEMGCKDMYKLYFKKELLVFVWGVEILSGACMSVIEGYLVEFFMSKYDKSMQFGGIILGVSVLFYPITSVTVERIGSRFHEAESKLLIGGMLINAGVLLLIGPIFTTDKLTTDMAISITGIFMLGCLSGFIQMSSLVIGINFLKTSVSSDMAVSTTINLVNMAYFSGSFIGPLVGGSLFKYFNYGTVFAVWSPVYVILGIFIAIYLSRIK